MKRAGWWCVWVLVGCDGEAATPASEVVDRETVDRETVGGDPDTSGPETSAPDTLAPDTFAPDTFAPDTSADSDPGDTGDTDTTPDSSWADVFAHVIPDDRLVQMRLDFAAGDWARLLADWQQLRQKNEYPAAFTHDAESLPRIGARLKGLNSLRIPDEGTPDPAGRYPLKLDFNSMGGERFHGVDELSLNACGNDPSRMRDWLTSHMYNAFGVHAARMGFAEVHIDGALVGPYVVSQVIDKRFLKERFGEADDADDGNLYKCVYNDFGACSLQWLGSNKADYYRTSGCQPGYDDCGLVLQTNEDDPAANDYADLIHFLDVLHHTPDDSFAGALAAVFDVEHFLRLAAVAYATSNFDSYFGKGHNYYLYRRNDGRFQMIPWDFDLAYELPTCPGDIADPTCGQPDSHPLTQKILAVPAWRERYLELLAEVTTTWLTRDTHAAWIDAADAIVRAAVARDPNPPDVGTGATYDSQIAPDGPESGGNLYRFIDTRRAFILAALAARRTP